MPFELPRCNVIYSKSTYGTNGGFECQFIFGIYRKYSWFVLGRSVAEIGVSTKNRKEPPFRVSFLFYWENLFICFREKSRENREERRVQNPAVKCCIAAAETLLSSLPALAGFRNVLRKKMPIADARKSIRIRYS